MSYITGNFPVMADEKKVGEVYIAHAGLLLVFDCTCHYKSHDILRLAAVCGGKYVPLGILMPYGSGPETGVLHLKKSFTKNVLSSIGYDETILYHLIKPGDVYSGNAEAESAVVKLERAAAMAGLASEPVIYNDFPNPEDYYFEPEAEATDEKPEPPVADVSRASAEKHVHMPEPEVYMPEPEVRLPEPVSAPAAVTPDAVSGWMHIDSPGILFGDRTIQESCADISNALMMEQDGSVLLAVPVLSNEPFPLMPVFCFGTSGEVNGQECIIFKIRNGYLTL